MLFVDLITKFAFSHITSKKIKKMENQPDSLPRMIGMYIFGLVIFLSTVYLISLAWKKGQA